MEPYHLIVIPWRGFRCFTLHFVERRGYECFGKIL